jgi:iron complex transport system substrate-binding protein
MLKKIGLILLIITVFTGLPASCSSSPKSTTPSSITITDDYNRTVTIVKYPQRIISLSPANTEILFALGLGSRIVGVSEYSDYPPEAANITSVGSYDKPNIEVIIAQQPDLVLASEEHEAETQQLESHGITVVAVNPKTVKDVLATINMIGNITGKGKEAAALTTSIQKRMDKITAKTSKLTDAQKPRVFYIIWHDPIWTTGAGTFHDELIQMAGGVNVAHDLSGYADMSLEAVVAANPQIIIAGVGMGTGESLTLKFVQDDARLSGVDARVNNKVFSANMDIVSRPGPRLADALETFFNLIHPEMK